MNSRMPVRLAREPLIEAIWELRFQSRARAVGDVLPGLVYRQLQNKYPHVVRLPVADIPRPIAQQEASLRYMPRIAMHAENQAVLLGERVAALSVRRPYRGWAKFSDDIRTLIAVLQETGLIDTIERFSLKYVDVIDIGPEPTLNWLNMTLRLGAHEIGAEPVQVRAEIREGNVTHMVQAISPAEVKFDDGSETLRGVLLEIDSVRLMTPGESWSVVQSELDAIHDSCKQMFFSLLTAETLAKLEPVYEE